MALEFRGWWQGRMTPESFFLTRDKTGVPVEIWIQRGKGPFNRNTQVFRVNKQWFKRLTHREVFGGTKPRCLANYQKDGILFHIRPASEQEARDLNTAPQKIALHRQYLLRKIPDVSV